jgi:predicted PurR-regulated permease PerM
MNRLLLNDRPYTLDRIFRLIVSLIAIALFILLLHYLRSVLAPFAVAFLLAYLLNPLVNTIQYKVRNRVVSLILALISVLLLVGVAIAIILPVVTNQMVYTASILQNTVLSQEIPSSIQQLLPAGVISEMQSMVQNTTVQTILENGDIMSVITKATNYIAPQLFTIFSGVNIVVSVFSTIIVICLYLFFLLVDFDSARKEWLGLVPKQYQTQVVQFLHDFNDAMSTYFRGQAIIASCTGILFAIGFSIISLPLAIVLGVLIGVLNMVPYLSIAGIPIALFLGIIQALSTGGSVVSYSVLILAVFAIVQLIQDIILTPKILGKSTGLSPVFILLALSIWGKILGLLGLLLAIPMTCLVLASYRRYLASHTSS